MLKIQYLFVCSFLNYLCIYMVVETKLKKRTRKNTISFQDLKKPQKPLEPNNQKSRFNSIFNRESILNINEKKPEGDKAENYCKKKDRTKLEIPNLTSHHKLNTSKNSSTQMKRRNFKLSKDMFGFQTTNRSGDSSVYHVSCDYGNVDKQSAFKKFRKVLHIRRCKHKQPMPILKDPRKCRDVYHHVKVLNSDSILSLDNKGSCLFYNITDHAHSHQTGTQANQDVKSCADIDKDPNTYDTSSTSVPITMCCCDAVCGFSRSELETPLQRQPCPYHDTLKKQIHPLTEYSAIGKRVKPKSSDRKKIVADLVESITNFHVEKSKNHGIKYCVKYALLGFIIILWSPCLLAVILAWIMLCPARTINFLAERYSKKTLFRSISKKIKEKEKKRLACGNNYECYQMQATCPCLPKKGILSTISRWYTRVAGSVVTTFQTMLSVLKENKDRVSSYAGSSFLRALKHPNPKKRYQLYYKNNRGWVMKPLRSQKYLQNMLCEVCPKKTQCTSKNKPGAKVTFENRHFCKTGNVHTLPPPPNLAHYDHPQYHTKQQVNITSKLPPPSTGVTNTAENSPSCMHKQISANICLPNNTRFLPLITNHAVPLYGVAASCPCNAIYYTTTDQNKFKSVNKDKDGQKVIYNMDIKPETKAAKKFFVSGKQTHPTQTTSLSPNFERISERFQGTNNKPLSLSIRDGPSHKIERFNKATQFTVTVTDNECTLLSITPQHKKNIISPSVHKLLKLVRAKREQNTPQFCKKICEDNVKASLSKKYFDEPSKIKKKSNLCQTEGRSAVKLLKVKSTKGSQCCEAEQSSEKKIQVDSIRPENRSQSCQTRKELTSMRTKSQSTSDQSSEMGIQANSIRPENSSRRCQTQSERKYLRNKLQTSSDMGISKTSPSFKTSFKCSQSKKTTPCVCNKSQNTSNVDHHKTCPYFEKKSAGNQTDKPLKSLQGQAQSMSDTTLDKLAKGFETLRRFSRRKQLPKLNKSQERSPVFRNNKANRYANHTHSDTKLKTKFLQLRGLLTSSSNSNNVGIDTTKYNRAKSKLPRRKETMNPQFKSEPKRTSNFLGVFNDVRSSKKVDHKLMSSLLKERRAGQKEKMSEYRIIKGRIYPKCKCETKRVNKKLNFLGVPKYVYSRCDCLRATFGEHSTLSHERKKRSYSEDVKNLVPLLKTMTPRSNTCFFKNLNINMAAHSSSSSHLRMKKNNIKNTKAHGRTTESSLGRNLRKPQTVEYDHKIQQLESDTIKAEPCCVSYFKENKQSRNKLVKSTPSSKGVKCACASSDFSKCCAKPKVSQPCKRRSKYPSYSKITSPKPHFIKKYAKRTCCPEDSEYRSSSQTYENASLFSSNREEFLNSKCLYNTYKTSTPQSFDISPVLVYQLTPKIPILERAQKYIQTVKTNTTTSKEIANKYAMRAKQILLNKTKNVFNNNKKTATSAPLQRANKDAASSKETNSLPFLKSTRKYFKNSNKTTIPTAKLQKDYSSDKIADAVNVEGKKSPALMRTVKNDLDTLKKEKKINTTQSLEKSYKSTIKTVKVNTSPPMKKNKINKTLSLQGAPNFGIETKQINTSPSLTKRQGNKVKIPKKMGTAGTLEQLYISESAYGLDTSKPNNTYGNKKNKHNFPDGTKLSAFSSIDLPYRIPEITHNIKKRRINLKVCDSGFTLKNLSSCKNKKTNVPSGSGWKKYRRNKKMCTSSLFEKNTKCKLKCCITRATSPILAKQAYSTCGSCKTEGSSFKKPCPCVITRPTLKSSLYKRFARGLKHPMPQHPLHTVPGDQINESPYRYYDGPLPCRHTKQLLLGPHMQQHPPCTHMQQYNPWSHIKQSKVNQQNSPCSHTKRIPLCQHINMLPIRQSRPESNKNKQYLTNSFCNLNQPKLCPGRMLLTNNNREVNIDSASNYNSKREKSPISLVTRRTATEQSNGLSSIPLPCNCSEDAIGIISDEMSREHLKSCRSKLEMPSPSQRSLSHVSSKPSSMSHSASDIICRNFLKSRLMKQIQKCRKSSRNTKTCKTSISERHLTEFESNDHLGKYKLNNVIDATTNLSHIFEILANRRSELSEPSESKSHSSPIISSSYTGDKLGLSENISGSHQSLKNCLANERPYTSTYKQRNSTEPLKCCSSSIQPQIMKARTQGTSPIVTLSPITEVKPAKSHKDKFKNTIRKTSSQHILHKTDSSSYSSVLNNFHHLPVISEICTPSRNKRFSAFTALYGHTPSKYQARFCRQSSGGRLKRVAANNVPIYLSRVDAYKNPGKCGHVITYCKSHELMKHGGLCNHKISSYNVCSSNIPRQCCRHNPYSMNKVRNNRAPPVCCENKLPHPLMPKGFIPYPELNPKAQLKYKCVSPRSICPQFPENILTNNSPKAPYSHGIAPVRRPAAVQRPIPVRRPPSGYGCPPERRQIPLQRPSPLPCLPSSHAVTKSPNMENKSHNAPAENSKMSQLLTKILSQETLKEPTKMSNILSKMLPQEPPAKPSQISKILSKMLPQETSGISSKVSAFLAKMLHAADGLDCTCVADIAHTQSGLCAEKNGGVTATRSGVTVPSGNSGVRYGNLNALGVSEGVTHGDVESTSGLGDVKDGGIKAPGGLSSVTRGDVNTPGSLLNGNVPNPGRVVPNKYGAVPQDIGYKYAPMRFRRPRIPPYGEGPKIKVKLDHKTLRRIVTKKANYLKLQKEINEKQAARRRIYNQMTKAKKQGYYSDKDDDNRSPWRRCFDGFTEVDQKAWPEEISCRHVYLNFMKEKPCFWIYRQCPAFYPYFLRIYSLHSALCRMVLLTISIFFWCPIIFCCYCCVQRSCCA